MLNPLQQMNPMGQGINNPMMGGGAGIPNQQPMNPMQMMQNMMFNNLYNNNPQFRAFADKLMNESMQGKTPDQAFQEYGLDYNQYKNVDPNQIKSSLGM